MSDEAHVVLAYAIGIGLVLGYALSLAARSWSSQRRRTDLEEVQS